MAGTNIVLIVKTDGMGVTDERELRETLASKSLALIMSASSLPRAIGFYTDGLTVSGSCATDRHC
jgi:hypothetical protein